MTVEPLIQDLINRFNDKVDTDEKLRTELNGMDKKVLVDLETEVYNFHLASSKIQNLNTGSIDAPDITVMSDIETFRGIIEGKIKPMKAFALRKVKIKGNIDDVLRLRKLF
ncbi:SCP2 sterol-binding domain-containing protein [Methanomassiliicoccus luminyensis]|uniref:SCP2 sterol-binding domain-containing protein n=1 Tax=Methanomassiliicoccus luminyensis TaxID=1080712 RepID=UPI000372C4CE|nr:SCP2 sterol-binding domain-containing protein [Methanomassiliicoccus luminyensis]